MTFALATDEWVGFDLLREHRFDVLCLSKTFAHFYKWGTWQSMKCKEGLQKGSPEVREKFVRPDFMRLIYRQFRHKSKDNHRGGVNFGLYQGGSETSTNLTVLSGMDVKNINKYLQSFPSRQ